MKCKIEKISAFIEKELNKANWKYSFISCIGLAIALLLVLMIMNNKALNPVEGKILSLYWVLLLNYYPIILWFLIVSWFLNKWIDLILLCVGSTYVCFLYAYILSEGGPKFSEINSGIFGDFWGMLFCLTILPALFSISKVTFTLLRKVMQRVKTIHQY